jgi:hypothetical protein
VKKPAWTTQDVITGSLQEEAEAPVRQLEAGREGGRAKSATLLALKIEEGLQATECGGL